MSHVAPDDGAKTAPYAGALSHDPETALDSAHVHTAETAFREWLDASRERADAEPLAPDADCDDGGASFPSPLLAHYIVLPSQVHGDTVVTRASVITVAEQDVDRNVDGRFIARQRIRTDVLEWDVIPIDNGWMVCNGIRFGYRGADAATRWTPAGASIASARALADSIRRANADDGRVAMRPGAR